MRNHRVLRSFGLLIAVLTLSALAAAQSSVKCESNDGHRQNCGTFNGQVTMDRQISGSPCIQGQTWGVDRGQLWVDRGCRAYFTVSNAGIPGDRRYDDRDRRDRDDRYNQPYAAGQNSIKCESNDGGRNYCGNVSGQVSMSQQISGSPCVQGQTWGVDRQGLWVDRGCRAYFTVAGRIDDRDRRDDDRDRDRRSDSGWWQRDPNDTWPPRGNQRGGNWGNGGACFYRDRNFSGDFFCLRRGEERATLEHIEGDISSIRFFGGARLTVYDESGFRGATERFGGDIPDLRQVAVRQKPGHTWNNRIYSIRMR